MLKENLVPLTKNKMAADMQKVVKRLLATGEAFAIWGAGNTGRSAREYLKECSGGYLAPKYIVDNNPSLWNKGRVIAPSQFFGLENPPAILFICSYVADQIAQQVKRAGYAGEVVIFSTLLLLDNQKRWEFYEKNMPAIETVYDMLADDKSKKTLEGFLNSIRIGDVTYLEKINGDSSEKLLDPLILQYTEGEVFADIGAFTGDTILKFLELTGGKYKRITGFEMDSQNYSILRQTIEEKENISLKNVAVGDRSGQTCYISGHSESSVLSEQGDCGIEMIALDDLPEMRDVSFMKVSANGMDLKVLKGAERLIRENAPKLAIYASGELLWKIPQYIKEIVPGYELYYRHYGYGQQAMICYAVLPAKKSI